MRLWDPERWSPDVRSKEDVSVWSVRLEGAAYEAALHPRTDDLLLAGSADRHAHVFDLRGAFVESGEGPNGSAGRRLTRPLCAGFAATIAQRGRTRGWRTRTRW